jgi:hypothetical protein
MGRTYSAKRRTSSLLGLKPFESANTVEGSNPARVNARTTQRILFLFIKKQGISFGIGLGICTSPN